MDVHAGGYAKRGSGSAPTLSGLTLTAALSSARTTPGGPFEPTAARAVYEASGSLRSAGFDLALVVGNRTVPSVSLDDTLEEAFGDAETVFMKWARARRPRRCAATRDPSVFVGYL